MNKQSLPVDIRQSYSAGVSLLLKETLFSSALFALAAADLEGELIC
ncbi:MAG: hypothetical protein AAGI69_09985 [Cyanobacteria bacterium P01_H01_bin.21]